MVGTSLSAFRDALQREEVRSISRRYFISNGFDGTLTAIGITVGAYLSGVDAGLTVVKIGVGATIGLATSGLWSVWEIERAEKLADIHRMEDELLHDLEDSRLMERKREGRVVNAVMSGLGPVIAMLLIISPFLLAGTVLSMLQATLASVGIGVAVLFGFGAYMGDVSEQNWVKAGARMGLAGIVVALLNVLLPG
ncbi:MAG: VIT1/CCC1 transporter family protein [Candidatus Nanohaloarchaea archaeon]